MKRNPAFIMKQHSGSLTFLSDCSSDLSGGVQGGMGLRQLPGSEQTNLRSLTTVLAAFLPLSMGCWRGEEEAWIVPVCFAAHSRDLVMI